MSNILYEHHGRVRLITINRADRMNSLDFEANDELIEVWREFDKDDDAYVAVITGAGDRAFCAGADLKTYTMDFARRPAELQAMPGGIALKGVVTAIICS